MSRTATSSDIEIDADQLGKLVRDLAATEKEVRAALNSTFSKMNRWLRTRASRGLSEHLQLPRSVIVRRMRSFQIRKIQGELEMRIWFGLWKIDPRDLKARQTKAGVTAASHKFPGAFMGPRPGVTAVKLRGRVFKRRGKKRLPIDKQGIDIHDKAQIYIEDELLGTTEFNEQFFKFFEHELKWRTQTRK